MQRLLFLSALVACLNLMGQNTVFTFAGARSAALNHATVALPQVWAGHHNQAASAFAEKASVALSFQNRYFLKELNLGHATFVYPSHWGAVGVNLSYFGSSIFNTTKLGLSYARKFGPHLAFGLQLNYESSFVQEAATLSTATFEAGLMASPTERLKIGLHLYNPNTASLDPQTGQKLPLLGRLGFSYQFNPAALLVMEVRSNLLSSERYAAGFEYKILDFMSLRSGLGLQDEYSATAGLGFQFQNFSLNTAYEYGFLLGSNLVYSLQYQF